MIMRGNRQPITAIDRHLMSSDCSVWLRRGRWQAVLLAALLCVGEATAGAAPRDGRTAATTRHDSRGGDDVEIIAGETRTIYEFRSNGQLRLVKVVPKFGVPYYLVPGGNGNRPADEVEIQKLYPRFVLFEF